MDEPLLLTRHAGPLLFFRQCSKMEVTEPGVTSKINQVVLIFRKLLSVASIISIFGIAELNDKVGIQH